MKYLITAAIVFISAIPSISQVKSPLLQFYRYPPISLQPINKNIDEHSTSDLLKTQVAIDSTVIIVSEINAEKYQAKFVFWQDVNISASDFNPPFIGDINKNKRVELYGWVVQNTERQPLAIYEYTDNGTFSKKFQFGNFNEGVLPRNIFDIDKDGREELGVHSFDSVGSVKVRFYKTLSDTSLFLTHYFNYPREKKNDQYDDPMWGDFDKDGKNDFLYTSYIIDNYMYIQEYNADSLYLDSIYSFDPKTSIAGFSVDDFDVDGKTDIVMSGGSGDIFVVECQGNNSYTKVWQGKVEYYNAYRHCGSNDIDGNGKKEFWIAGINYPGSGPLRTQFTCFENDGDNTYKAVGKIDIVCPIPITNGGFNYFAKDVDGDGKEELCICLYQHFFILKFTGSVNHQKYSVLYYKKDELADQKGSFLGATFYDIDNAGQPELLITHSIFNDFGYQEFTRIYRQAEPLLVNQFYSKTSPSQFMLRQNYPNPFNPVTTISYDLVASSHVSLIVYDYLGREVETLINNFEAEGNHSFIFDGDKLPSGVYFYKINAGLFTSIKKMVLLK